MLNKKITEADFQKLPASIRDAFVGSKAAVVELAPGAKLHKLSSYPIPADKNASLTPWWSSVDPYKDDELGARGRYLEAKLNQVSMKDMVRFAAAIRLDWNDIENYLEVKLKDGAYAYWGLFAPQPAVTPVDVSKFSLDGPMSIFDLDKMVTQMCTNAAKRKRAKDAGGYVPETLGGIEAWQLFIPDLKVGDVEECPSIPSHDMAALGVHFSVL